MLNISGNAVGDLDTALASLRDASSQSNQKGADLLKWFNHYVNETVAVSYIKDPKYIRNRFKEQKEKFAKNTVFLFNDESLLKRTAALISEYVEPGHERVYFFTHGPKPTKGAPNNFILHLRLLTDLANDPLYALVGNHFGQPEVGTLPAPPQGSVQGTAVVSTIDVGPDLDRSIDEVEPNESGQFPLDQPLQLIVHGCPGSGKSHLLQETASHAHFTVRTVFHPSTKYTDFVGGLRPESVYLVGEDKTFIGAENELPGEPYVQYVVRPGPLLRAYRLACLHPTLSVVLLIEELSRAVASEVFGDMLQLLDRHDTAGDKLCGYSEYEIEPQPDVRAWLRMNGIRHDMVAAGNMRFPPNLYIWATMNRSDQNARQLDSAFLRRWSKRYLSYLVAGAYDSAQVRYGGAIVTWGELRSSINERLRSLEGIPEDKFLGPYFLSERELADPRAIYEDIWGYIWNDVLKSRATHFFDGAETFAELQKVWNDGAGRPIGVLGTESLANAV